MQSSDLILKKIIKAALSMTLYSLSYIWSVCTQEGDFSPHWNPPVHWWPGWRPLAPSFSPQPESFPSLPSLQQSSRKPSVQPPPPLSGPRPWPVASPRSPPLLCNRGETSGLSLAHHVLHQWKQTADPHAVIHHACSVSDIDVIVFSSLSLLLK